MSTQDQLTWERDGNSIVYRLNGIQLARLLDYRRLDRRPLIVIAAIRRFAPRLSSYEAAVAMWDERVEEKPLTGGSAAALSRRRECEQSHIEERIGRGAIRDHEAEDYTETFHLALDAGSRKPNLDEQEQSKRKWNL
jgi:hypothetical protein